MSEQLNRMAAEEEAVFLARESFISELKALNRRYPRTGFGISLCTHSGEKYLLANSSMPLPGKKSQGFPTGQRVASLENGSRFRSIEVLADSEAVATFNPKTEADMLSDVLDLIARIEAPANLFAGRIGAQKDSGNVVRGIGG